MKYEQALQQVLTTYNAQLTDDDGSVMFSDLDGLGEIERCVQHLRQSVYNKDRTSDQRMHAKHVAAMALRYMVDRT